MRVDNATGNARFGDLDALSRLKGYVSALRRRWYLILIPVLVGMGLGWLSAPEAPGPPGTVAAGPTYYRAAHVLIDDTQGLSFGDGSPSVNLTQAAYLVSTGEIPGKVAAKLGIPVEEVSASVIAFPRSAVSSVEVQAIGRDEAQVVKLADTAANQLLETLLADAQRDADTSRDLVIAQIDKLDGQISDLTIQIAGAPANTEQLQAQLLSVTNQYRLAQEQFAQLVNRATPTAGLASLEGAKAQEISKAEFDRAKRVIRDGADYVTGIAPETAPIAGGPSSPGAGASASTRAVMGGVFGLGLGMGLVLLLDRFDSRLRRRDDVEAATGLTVVAEIPPLTRHQQHALEVVAHTQHRSRAAEAYRVVRGAVLFALNNPEAEQLRVEGEAIVLMVTSANPAEGKTTTVANMAAVLAEGGFNVLVINCDFRRPRVHKYLLASPGKPDKALNEPSEVARQGSVVVANTNIERVRLITGLGEDDPNANPLDVVATQRKIIAATRSRFDVILLDTAPFLTTNDASELLSEVDQVLLVVRCGKTKVDAARRTAEILERFEAPVLGVVMNDSDESPAAQYYYGYSTDSEKKGRRRSASGSGSTKSFESAPAAERANGRDEGGPGGGVNGGATAVSDPSVSLRRP